MVFVKLPRLAVRSRRAAPGRHRARCPVPADLVEVAVRTSSDGHFQEHASFLLAAADGDWHVVDFADPEAGAVVEHLLSLPGFDRERLAELVLSRDARIIRLWRRTAAPAPVVPCPAPVVAAPVVAAPVVAASVVAAEGAPAPSIPLVPAQRSAEPAPTGPARPTAVPG